MLPVGSGQEEMEPSNAENGGESKPVDEKRKTMAKFAFKRFVENSPEYLALLRHISTLLCPEQRQRLLIEFQPRTYKYCSGFYPMEAIWYLENLLPKTKPTNDELWWHQNGLCQTSMTIFSYIDIDTGLLARHNITLLVDPGVKSSTLDVAFAYKKAIINHGGMSSVQTDPNVLWSTTLVVIGPLKKRWENCVLPLYSSKLVKEALESGKFDYASISKYQLYKKPHVCLSINYASTLM